MLKKIKALGEAIKFSHTIFSLPFGLASILLLYKGQLPDWKKIGLIILAIIIARTAGMAFNRWLDYEIDRKNPRTKNWPHIRGEISLEWLKILAVFSSALFIIISYFINIWAFLLSPVVIFLLWFYPLGKRITYFPHFILGLIYFLIPIAVDIALNEEISLLAFLLGLAMASWVIGFDLLYSLADYEFDKKHGVKSLAVKLGPEKTLKISALMHFLTFISLVLIGFLHPKLGIIYYMGLFLLSVFLFYEHRLIKPHDLRKLNTAFFTLNAWISVLFFVIVAIDFLF